MASPTRRKIDLTSSGEFLTSRLPSTRHHRSEAWTRVDTPFSWSLSTAATVSTYCTQVPSRKRVALKRPSQELLRPPVMRNSTSARALSSASNSFASLTMRAARSRLLFSLARRLRREEAAPLQLWLQIPIVKVFPAGSGDTAGECLEDEHQNGEELADTPEASRAPRPDVNVSSLSMLTTLLRFLPAPLQPRAAPMPP